MTGPSNLNGDSNPTLQLQRVAIADLRQDPRNARQHDRRNIDAIKESLATFGQVLPVVVRAGQIVGGNATTTAAQELGWTHLDATPADHLSEQEAVALAIALNRTAELASWDASVLIDALQGLPALEGTGFTAEELAGLEAALNPEPFDPEREWQGMPEFKSENLGSVFHVVVHFKSPEDAEAFFRLIDRPQQKSMWWPESDGHKTSDYRSAYVAADAAQP
jgi:ParB-like nuclease domain